MEISRRAVRSKEFIYLVVFHELAYCITTASRRCQHMHHGNAYLKSLEIFYQWDSSADFYLPSRQAGYDKLYLYRCQDSLRGKIMSEKNDDELYMQ